MGLGPEWEEYKCLMVPSGPECALKQPLEQLVGLKEPQVQEFDELQLRELLELLVWAPEQLVVVQLLQLHAVPYVRL